MGAHFGECLKEFGVVFHRQRRCYAESQGMFKHDTRKAIFVGDFVDCGPEQREVLRIARNMCEAGTAHAVLGNHKLNAIAWATSNGDGGYLRRRSEKNASQHLKFLRQLDEGSHEYKNAIAWFRQLPVWLELPGLRVVHACWHEHRPLPWWREVTWKLETTDCSFAKLAQPTQAIVTQMLTEITSGKADADTKRRSTARSITS
jgi:hypothetical protein